jgi:hypothetical protein
MFYYDKMKNILTPGNSCYHSDLNLLFSCVFSKGLKIQIHKTTILPLVLCGYFWVLNQQDEMDGPCNMGKMRN